MNLDKIKTCLVQWFGERSTEKVLPKASSVFVVPLLEKLTAQQLFQLQNGSGNPIAEMYQVNSSTGLAVNYYKLFERTHKGVTVEFEWKESVPLLKSTAPANLDVRYEMNNTVYFIECKYLEPYYSPKPKNNDAYLDSDRYPFEEHKAEWPELFKHERKFKYFDYPQLCRHLLAIYRHYLEHPEQYQDKSIVLRSVCWKMTQSFKDFYKNLGLDVGDMDERCLVIEEEKALAKQLFNEHLQNKIGWTDCSFDTKNYNDDDMLIEISAAKKYDKFIKQYFLES